MAVWSTITTSQIEYSRIDADYYHPQYMQDLVVWNALGQHTSVSKLRHLISAPVRTGRTPRLRRIKDGEPCVPFIKTDTVREGQISFDSAAYLPSRILNAKDYIPCDSVLVTIIGATPEIVGRAAIVRSTDSKSVTNQNVAVISTNDSCDPYFLTAYLQTSMGRDQLWRHSRRTEQVNLNCREVERILVPLPASSTQLEIGDLVRESLATMDRSAVLLVEARDLFESKLGMDTHSFNTPLCYTGQFSEISLSDTFSVGRLDAQCFSPDAVFCEDWLLKHARCDRLARLLQDTAKGHKQTEAQNGPTHYCSIKHISGLELIGASKCHPVPKTSLARPNDLLLAITGATIGKVGIVKRYEGLAFSGCLFR